MTKSILLRGPLLTKSGYGVHSRQIARWLFDKAEEPSKSDDDSIEITTELLPWGITPWFTDVYAEDGLIGKLVQSSVSPKQFYDLTIQIQLPNEWNPFLGSFNVGVTAGVEASSCNPQWVECVNRMQLVIVPSEFTKQTFLNSGKVTTPIIVVPESFPDAMLASNLTTSVIDELPLDLTSSFNFLTIGQLTGNNPENDRKNLLYTIKWFYEAFKNKPDVGLIIKTAMLRQTHLDRTMVTNVFNKVLSELGVTESGPKFYLLHGDMQDSELVSLYTSKKIKAFLSLTHGEGYGLPLLEAAACGLPVIATGWSGHTEFLSVGKWLKIDYKLGPVHPTRVDNTIFMQGVSWAYPQEEHAKARMLKFYESSSIPNQWAKETQPLIQSRFNFKEIAKKLDGVFEEHKALGV